MVVKRIINKIKPEWTLYEAASVDEALVIMASEHIDIFLLDYNMPGKNGIELVRMTNIEYSRNPSAIISANIQDEIIAETRKIGATFIPKPLTEEVIPGFISGAMLRLRKTGKLAN